MSEERLKELSIDDLLKLLAVSQRNFSLFKLYSQGADVIEHKKSQLEKVQKAIVDKRGDHCPGNESFFERPSIPCLLLAQQAFLLPEGSIYTL